MAGHFLMCRSAVYRVLDFQPSLFVREGNNANIGTRTLAGAAAAALLSAGVMGVAAIGAYAADASTGAATGAALSTAASSSSTQAGNSNGAVSGPSKGSATGSGSESAGSSSSSSATKPETSESTKTAPQPKPKPKAVARYLVRDAGLYRSAKDSSKRLAVVGVGAKVKAWEAKGSWCRVTYGKKSGYIAVSALTANKAKAQKAKKEIVAARKAAAKRAAKKRWEKPSTAKKAGTWHYKKHGRYKVKSWFRYKNGTYPTGITKIKGVTYYFKNQKGQLSRSHKVRRLVKVGSRYYNVNGSSVVQHGWDVVGGHLYDFAGKYGAALQNEKRKGITLASNGRAVMNLEASVKKKCITTLRRITNRHAAKYVQLRAVWNYLVSHRHFRYVGIDINPYNRSWAKRYANQMLTTHGGDCYGFSATFAALANEIGYRNVRLITGSVTNGNLHCAVKINGLWYDPEEHWNGYIYGVHGLGGNPSNFARYTTNRLYRSYDGSGADRGVTRAYRAAKSGISVVRKGGK